MKKQVDAIIIGSGVIGCAVAFELAKKGYKTLNIDKLPDAGFGPTSNSCAIIRFHYSTFDGIAMSHEGYFYWKDWPNYIGVEDERGLIKYREVGLVVIESHKDEYKSIVDKFGELGIPYEQWDADTMKEKYPVLSTGGFWPARLPEDEGFWDEPHSKIHGAIFTPQAGYVNDPQLATHNLMRAAEAYGGEFWFNTEVSGISHSKKQVEGVTLKDGRTVDATIVVNVAGPHSFVINRMAGVEKGMRIRTRALRHEVHNVPSPKGFDFERDGTTVHDGGLGIYFRPEVGNSMIVGSGDPECDPKEWIDDPDNFNRSVTNSRWEAQVYRLAKRMPHLEIPHEASGLVDLYDVSDDWIPIYDKSDLGGFYMAVGTSGNQFKNAGPVGYMMAEIIDACENGQDHDAEPVQVKCRYTGRTLNAGFYSRLRKMNPESSYSVMG